ncbi:MAG: hypothetical protein EOO62_16745 [Hymenobacter sp.]|nr:MAG: hypothetical protein EOO62_16745 [Hymenobacter sp.]
MPSANAGTEDDGAGLFALDAYDATRLELIEQFEGQTKIFLVDPDNSVRRAFLSSVTSLCVFFGESKASEVILSHLNTYLNDPDWILKCAFFKTIIGVAVYIGGASLEEFILPLMLQALSDPQESVVEQVLRSLANMAELGLLQRAKTWELIGEVLRSKDRVLPLFVSPGHRCDQATATRLTLACLRGYKLPEPTRLADHWAEAFKVEVR